MKFKIILFILLTCAFTQEVTLTFDCLEEVVTGSEENEFSIMMENTEIVSGGGLTINTNHEGEIVILDFRRGELVDDWSVSCNDNTEENGEIHCIFWSGAGQVIYPGIGFLLHFTFRSNIEFGDLNLSFSNIEISNNDGELTTTFADTYTIPVVEPEPFVLIEIGEINSNEETIEILIDTNVPSLHGLQFSISGLAVSEGNYSGIANDSGWMVATDGEVVLMGSFGALNTISSLNGSLATFDYISIDSSSVCIHDIIGSVTTGNWQEIEFISGDCINLPPQIGDECELENGESGFYDCLTLNCHPVEHLEFLGDDNCEDGMWDFSFDCPEFGYDCGDCSSDWDGSDPLGYCSADCDIGFTYSPILPDNIKSDGNCLYTDDLVVLVDLITINDIDYESPLYMGQQTWENGRLIHLYANNLTLTQLPDNINQLDSLLILDVSNNEITELPGTLWLMNTLYSLHAEYNQLTQISTEISNMQNLHGVYLRNNQIQSIPIEFWDVSNLSSVFLSENEISGELPFEISNAQNLLWLWLEGNQLSGNIPEIICSLNPELFLGNCSGEPHFRIYGNELCPPYPDCSMEFIGYQNTEYCIACSEVLGDTNNDEIVNVLDIVSIVNLLILTDDPPPDSTCYDNADMNADEEINILDIVIMVDLILVEE